MSLTKKTIVAGILVCGVNTGVQASNNTEIVADLEVVNKNDITNLADVNRSGKESSKDVSKLDEQPLEAFNGELARTKVLSNKRRHPDPEDSFFSWWDSLWSDAKKETKS